jgi:predicted amidohydrolase
MRRIAVSSFPSDPPFSGAAATTPRAPKRRSGGLLAINRNPRKRRVWVFRLEIHCHMSEPARYYAATCQTDLPCPRDRSALAARVAQLLKMVDRAVRGYEPFFDVKLVVFPEFAHAAPIYETVSELTEPLAVPIPNEHTDQYAKKARERGVFIQTGTFLEIDLKWPGVVFNTTCLIGPDGILSRYRKANPWLPWEIHASPHDLKGYDDPLFPVVETEIGRLGAAICLSHLRTEAYTELYTRPIFRRGGRPA